MAGSNFAARASCWSIAVFVLAVVISDAAAREGETTSRLAVLDPGGGIGPQIREVVRVPPKKGARPPGLTPPPSG